MSDEWNDSYSYGGSNVDECDWTCHHGSYSDCDCHRRRGCCHKGRWHHRDHHDQSWF